MKLGRAFRRSRPEVMIAPLIDVVFLLLIFYAVTTQFVTDERLKLTLPEAKTAEETGQGMKKAPPTITIASDGSVWVDNEEIPDVRLEATVQRLVERAGDQSLIIRGDQVADYGVVVRVLDLARAAGAESIQMSAERPPSEGE